MKRPSFQFYPADWRKDANLRRCSPAARGVWMDLLCILHDSEQYGIVKWPLKELAAAAGASMAHVRELVDKNVLKGCDKGECGDFIYTPRHGRVNGQPVALILNQPGPLWFCARFVRDEYVRTVRGIGSRFGDDNGASPKAAPKTSFGDGPSSASSPSGNTSVANATGAVAPPDPADVIFGLGVPLITSAGVSDKNARSMLGLFRKDHTDAEVIAALQRCATEKPLQPVPWLQGVLKANGSHHVKAGKHVGFATKDYREGVTNDGSLV